LRNAGAAGAGDASRTYALGDEAGLGGTVEDDNNDKKGLGKEAGSRITLSLTAAATTNTGDVGSSTCARLLLVEGVAGCAEVGARYIYMCVCVCLYIYLLPCAFPLPFFSPIIVER
jgi:hypothetical protein